MSENLNPAGYDEAELAYLNSQGEIPLPPSEAEPRQEELKSEPEGATGEPAPEPADPDADDAAPEDFNGRTAKWGAYLRKKGEADAARKERDELRSRLEAREREFAAQQARIDERFKLWQASQQQAPAPQPAPKAPEPPPDVDNDPLAYIKYQDQQRAALEERLNTIAQSHEQTIAQTRQAQEIQRLDRSYQEDNRQAAREMPEYPDAYNFLLNMAEQDVIIQNGGRLTPAQAKEHVLMQERQLAAAAFQQNVRPAQMILQMAHARGWKPPSARQAPASQTDPAAEQARIDAAARGQAQNRSLSGTGRSTAAPTGAMTLEKFMSMSDEDARVWAEKNPAEHRRIGGGQ